jgi:hypothetical protein
MNNSTTWDHRHPDRWKRPTRDQELQASILEELRTNGIRAAARRFGMAVQTIKDIRDEALAQAALRSFRARKPMGPLLSPDRVAELLRPGGRFHYMPPTNAASQVRPTGGSHA